MRNCSYFRRAAALTATVLLGGAAIASSQEATPQAISSQPARTPPGIGARADRILLEMSDYLATAQELTFQAEVSYGELSNGQMLQYGGVTRAALRRPDGLRVRFDGDTRRHEIVFDGSVFTAYDAVRNLHAVTPVPGDIDQALDTLFERFGFSVPIADLLYSNPYAALTGSVDAGHLVGQRSIDGVPCHHLAFLQETIDWQIWIEIGARPVPRQLVITYKDEEGAPEYRARLSGWSFQPRLSKRSFEFDPPAGSDAIEFRPVARQEATP
jgi:hypothetical protein